MRAYCGRLEKDSLGFSPSSETSPPFNSSMTSILRRILDWMRAKARQQRCGAVCAQTLTPTLSQRARESNRYDYAGSNIPLSVSTMLPYDAPCTLAGINEHIHQGFSFRNRHQCADFSGHGASCRSQQSFHATSRCSIRRPLFRVSQCALFECRSVK